MLNGSLGGKKRTIESLHKVGMPFHTIVVTSPDATAAKAAFNGPLGRENFHHASTKEPS
jgi:hypothetical protein